MPFKKGDPKPPGSGAVKGQKYKKKILKISDFVRESEVPIAEQIWNTIQTIEDPIQKSKLMLEYYKFVDAPVKERTNDEESILEESTTDLISLVNNLE
jgi:hypothetical protein